MDATSDVNSSFRQYRDRNGAVQPVSTCRVRAMSSGPLWLAPRRRASAARRNLVRFKPTLNVIVSSGVNHHVDVAAAAASSHRCWRSRRYTFSNIFFTLVWWAKRYYVCHISILFENDMGMGRSEFAVPVKDPVSVEQDRILRRLYGPLLCQYVPRSQAS